MNISEREIFWKTLCTLDGRDLISDSLKLREVIKYPKTQTLCRYRNVSSHTIEALQTNKLYFSSADYYDDPFDTNLSLDWDLIKSQIINNHDFSSPAQFDAFIQGCKQFGLPIDGITFDKFSKLNSQDVFNLTKSNLQFIRQIFKKNLFSVSFAEDPLNENLWLKYANNHYGFCLEYDISENSNLMTGEVQNIPLYPVYYSNEKYNATNFAISTLGFYVIAANNPKALNEYQKKLPMWWETEKVSLIKHKCHEYDLEWRIISHQTKRSYIKWTPVGIYIGLRTKPIEKKLIVRTAVTAGIKHIYNISISSTDELEKEELTEQEIKNLLE